MWLHSEGLGLGSTFAFGVPLSKRKEPTADPKTGAPLKPGRQGGVQLSAPQRPSLDKAAPLLRTPDQSAPRGASSVKSILVSSADHSQRVGDGASGGGGGGVPVVAPVKTAAKGGGGVAATRNKVHVAAADDHPEGPRKRALVAEDDETCRAMMAKVLEGLGYVVDEADDGAVAVARMHAALHGAAAYDVVLTDWVMPNMDGPTAVATMRADGYRGPVFGVTGNALEADIARFVSVGADRVLTKPLKVAELKKALADRLVLPNAAAGGAPAHQQQDEAKAEMQTKAAAAAQASVPPAVAGTKRVLIAEDDAVCRKMLARVLKSMNYEVAEAEDGAVALDMMRASTKSENASSQPFDLVLSDFTMPNMDGPDSVAGMRDAHYAGPIFGVTGNQLQADIDLFIAKGADKVIAKPLKLPALKQAIQDYEEEQRRRTTINTVEVKTTAPDI
jgi:hypothetical protein